MAFSDPQTIDIEGDDNQVFNKAEQLPTGTVFRTADGSAEFSVLHTYAKRTRRAVRLRYDVLNPDPYNADLNVPYSMSATLVLDTPKVGMTETTQLVVAKALLAYLASSSYAPLTKVIEGQL